MQIAQRLAKISKMVVSPLGIRTRLSSSSPTIATAPLPPALKDFDPHNYQLPFRPVSYDDLMEPYGDWKVALEAERRLANKTLVAGILAMIGAITILELTGWKDGAYMPNLDRIMEETEGRHPDLEGRISVR